MASLPRSINRRVPRTTVRERSPVRVREPVRPTLSNGAPSLVAQKPATLEALRQQIQSSPHLTPRMRDAAQYSLDHPSDIALSPVATVARRAGLAPTAFVRLAKVLGFEGYSDLQALFRAPLREAVPPTFRERIRHHGGELTLEHPEDPHEVLRAFSQANIVSLQHLQAESQKLPLQRAVSMMQKARMVYVIGLRRSFALASYLAYALNRVGRSAVQITAMGGSVVEQARVVEAHDLLVAISFPPYAPDTVNICEQVRGQGAQLLAVTNGLLSPVSLNAHLTLEIDDAEIKGFRSLTSSLCLVQSLVMALAFDKRYQRWKSLQQKGDGTALPDFSDIDC